MPASTSTTSSPQRFCAYAPNTFTAMKIVNNVPSRDRTIAEVLVRFGAATSYVSASWTAADESAIAGVLSVRGAGGGAERGDVPTRVAGLDGDGVGLRGRQVGQRRERPTDPGLSRPEAIRTRHGELPALHVGDADHPGQACQADAGRGEVRAGRAPGRV